jgi:ABC-type methionine transport system permease subunit
MIGVVAMMFFLAAGRQLGVLLIKNRFQLRTTAVIMVVQLPLLLLITSITSLGNTFVPFLSAILIATHYTLRRGE